MPTALPTVSRRRLIVGGTALALLGGTLTACGNTPPVEDVDALLGQFERAQSDATLAGNAAAAALAGTAAPAAPTPLVAALTAVATQRTAHAKALSEEITRISGDAPPTPTPTPTTTTSTTTTGSTTTTANSPPPKPPTAADVVASLGQSADAASLLATQQSGYRAGLLGSIAAACTAAASVALLDPGQSS